MALVVALCSIPLLLLDDGSSADGETVGAAPEPVPTTTVVDTEPIVATPVEPDGPSASLVERSLRWRAARADLIEANTERALDLAAEAADGDLADPVAADDPVEAEPESVTATETPEPVPEPEPVAPTTTAPPATTTPPPPPTTTTAPPPPPAAQPGEPTPAQWEALRQCESGGNYNAVSPNGLYRGAYQFSRATWDGVAAAHYPHLVGVDPATAAPPDQDAMALALWRMSGSGPWPHCGVHLN